MTNKCLVIDTSALISDSNLLFAYPSHHLYICLTVLQELDNLKTRGNRELAYSARAAIRNIENQIKGHSAIQLANGINISSSTNDNHGVLHIIVEDNSNLDSACSNDDKIINTAVNLKKEHEQVAVISNDINFRIKALTLGIDTLLDSKSDNAKDEDYIYSGVEVFSGDFFDKLVSNDDFKLSGSMYEISRALFSDDIFVNSYWHDDAGHIGVIKNITEKHVYTELINCGQSAWDLKAKNIRQEIALHQLLSPKFDLNILLGGAGTGKTLLGVSAALQLVLESKTYDNIMVVRSRDFMDDEPGFLPGNLTEKSMPLLGGVIDALTFLHKGDAGNIQETLNYIIEKANITFESLAYLRGRSLDSCILIVDECQNMTYEQLKGVLSRSSSNCKIILCGNLGQIDNKAITAQSSSLVDLIEIYRNYSGASSVILNEVERSPLAAFTEEYF
jgi:PhoH-like ATPase